MNRRISLYLGFDTTGSQVMIKNQSPQIKVFEPLELRCSSMRNTRGLSCAYAYTADLEMFQPLEGRFLSLYELRYKLIPLHRRL